MVKFDRISLIYVVPFIKVINIFAHEGNVVARYDSFGDTKQVHNMALKPIWFDDLDLP